MGRRRFSFDIIPLENRFFSVPSVVMGRGRAIRGFSGDSGSFRVSGMASSSFLLFPTNSDAIGRVGVRGLVSSSKKYCSPFSPLLLCSDRVLPYLPGLFGLCGALSSTVSACTAFSTQAKYFINPPYRHPAESGSPMSRGQRMLDINHISFLALSNIWWRGNGSLQEELEKSGGVDDI